MICTVCKVETEKGFLSEGFWISGEKSKLQSVLAPGRKSLWAFAYRCPKCGKVEIITETEE